MENEERGLYAERKAQELREDEARIAGIEAQAREEDAREAIEELSGIKRLKESVKQRMQQLADQNTRDWEQVRADVDAGSGRLKTALQGLGDRLRDIDDQREKRLNAQLDQIDASIAQLDSQITQGYLTSAIEVQRAMDRLKEQQRQAEEQRRAVAEARKDARKRVLDGFKRSIEILKQSFSDASAKVDAAREGGAQPHA